MIVMFEENSEVHLILIYFFSTLHLHHIGHQTREHEHVTCHNDLTLRSSPYLQSFQEPLRNVQLTFRICLHKVSYLPPHPTIFRHGMPCTPECLCLGGLGVGKDSSPIAVTKCHSLRCVALGNRGNVTAAFRSGSSCVF